MSFIWRDIDVDHFLARILNILFRSTELRVSFVCLSEYYQFVTSGVVML
jgi:hypothetical protein